MIEHQEKKEQLPKILLGLSLIFLSLTAWFIWLQMETAEKGFLYRQGKDLEEHGKYTQAEQLFLYLHTLDSSAHVELALAQIQGKIGKSKEGMQQIEKLIERSEKPIPIDYIQSYLNIAKQHISVDSIQILLPQIMRYTHSFFYFAGGDKYFSTIWIAANENPDSIKLKTWIEILKNIYPGRSVRLDVVKSVTDNQIKPIQAYFWETYDIQKAVISESTEITHTHTHTQDSSFANQAILQKIKPEPLYYYWFGQKRHPEVIAFRQGLLKTIQHGNPLALLSFFKNIHAVNLVSYQNPNYTLKEEDFSDLPSDILEAIHKKLSQTKKYPLEAQVLHKGIQSILHKRKIS